MPRVVIIGAGISGLCAASYLLKNSFDSFVILEAQSRIGGRIQSYDLKHDPDLKTVWEKEFNNRDKELPTSLELGAYAIHGVKGNPVFTLAQEQGLVNVVPTRRITDRIMHRQINGEKIDIQVLNHVDWVYGRLLQECEAFYRMNLPVPKQYFNNCESFIRHEFQLRRHRRHGNVHISLDGEGDRRDFDNDHDNQLMDSILDQRLLLEACITGSGSMSDVSLSQFGSYKELPGVHYCIPDGFSALIKSVGAEIPAEKILLNHVVEQIEVDGIPLPLGEFSDRSKYIPSKSAGFTSVSSLLKTPPKNPVRVKCKNGTMISCDHVLVTCSLGVLQQAGAELFTPILPAEKHSAMDRLRIGFVNKVFLAFDQPVIEGGIARIEVFRPRQKQRECTTSSAISSDNTRNWLDDVYEWRVVSPSILMCFSSGRMARNLELIDENDIMRDATIQLRCILKKPDLPEPVKVIRTKWVSNEFTRGSYSYLPVGASQEDIRTMAKPIHFTDGHDKTMRILFGGEHTHPLYYSTTHGALLTGEREAKRILDFYSYADATQCISSTSDGSVLSRTTGSNSSLTTAVGEDVPVILPASNFKVELDRTRCRNIRNQSTSSVDSDDSAIIFNC